jgi:hypothetical protein
MTMDLVDGTDEDGYSTSRKLINVMVADDDAEVRAFAEFVKVTGASGS